MASPLTDDEIRLCRAILHIAAKQPKECLVERAWYQERNGKKCYNPYAVAHHSVKGVGNVKCGQHYKFEELPDDELRAYAYLERLPINDYMTRDELLHAIHESKGILKQ